MFDSHSFFFLVAQICTDVLNVDFWLLSKQVIPTAAAETAHFLMFAQDKILFFCI